MNALSTKKLLIAGLAVATMALTGCLTDDKKDSTPTDPAVKIAFESMNDTIWNLQGPKKGAFDLLGDSAVSASKSDSIKDAKDMSSVGTSAIVFPKTWTSTNGTMFVTAAAGFSYDSATDSTAIRGYKAGTPSATTKVLAAGDIILAKIRGGSKYAVIKIKTVTETSADNLDFVAFSYKRTP
ncbi:MAG TPA: hypothetical protein DCQ83_06125 [Fibrobacteres bacterium]|jgi:hypothetical protein|nr:hypothetical protein [Fibrobacterota bacterium]